MVHSPPRYQVRVMLPEDIPAVIALQGSVFPTMPPWNADQLASHLAVFPQGQVVATDETGRIVGSSSSLIIAKDDFDQLANWSKITADGYFTTHNPELGKTLYGADIGVDPVARGQGVGAMLYEARKKTVVRFNLKRMVAGGRIPGYGKVAHLMTPEQYVEEVVAGRRSDQVLGFQIQNGFSVVRVIPDYLSFDKESKGFATLIEWKNPSYH